MHCHGVPSKGWAKCEHVGGEDEPEGKGCKECWMPRLKTPGDIDDDKNMYT